MSRDVRRTTKTTLYERYVLPSNTRIVSNSAVAVLVDRARADAVSTQKVQDQYIYPTNYSGRFFWSSPQRFEYEGRKPTTSWYRVTGESSLNLLLATTMETYGLGGASRLPVFPTSAQSAADARLLSQITSGNWNVGQSLAELPETVGFIVDLISTVSALAKSIRSGAWREVFEMLKVLSMSDAAYKAYSFRPKVWNHETLRRIGQRRVTLNRQLNALNYSEIWKHPRAIRRLCRKAAASGWLGYQFAWLPLLSDIYEALNLIQNGLSSPNGFSAATEVTVEPLPPPTFRKGMEWYKYKWSCKRQIKAELWYRVSNAELFKYTQMGLTNPLGLAWELLPLSFVVDWLIPVGTFLSSLTRPMGLTFSHGYTTSWMEWNFWAQWAYDPQIRKGEPLSITAGHEAFTRTLYLSFPTPAPYFRGFGDFVSPEGWTKSISALALLMK